MRILYKPGCNSKAHTLQVPNNTTVLSQLLDGYIERYGIGNKVLILMDEDGKLKGKEPTIADPLLGVIAGPVIFTGSRGSHIAAISDDQIEWLKERYGEWL
ncbi:MAG: DUF3846 domain-containing protein [Firmicutes bacterium]|nr:DUF3846 domain-containing protein [Bacillota bacterium]